MNKILAIARLMIAGAIRSRVLVSLVLLLAVALVGVPLTIKSDGTIAGKVQVLLYYNLGITFAILAIATVWVGCAGISSEVQESQIVLVDTKPVRRFQIWIGKWLGLVGMNAALLAFAGLVTFGFVKWTARPSVTTAEDRRILKERVLVARRCVTPESPDIEAEARRQFDEMSKSASLPEGESPEKTIEAIRRRLEQTRYLVRPGETGHWVIHLGALPPPDSNIILKFRFLSSRYVERAPISGEWRAGGGSATETAARAGSWMPGRTHTIEIPASAVGPDGALELRFANLEREESGGVLFYSGDGIAAHVKAGNFGGNFIRALSVLLWKLALFAAVGTAAGSLFSLPVAALTSFFALFLATLGGYAHTVATSGLRDHAFGRVTAISRAMEAVVVLLFEALNAVCWPLTAWDPLTPLMEGRLVSWATTWTAFAALVVAYTACLALVSGWFFNRRELGIGSQ